MPNKALFDTRRAAVPSAKTSNEAGGRAYSMSDKQSLAQYAATGCFQGTYYVNAEDQLSTVNKLLASVEPEFIAKCAIYTRTKSYMKDMPAFLVAYLAVEHPEREDLLKAVFPVVIDNGKMLRNVVTFVRSDPFGWKGSDSDPDRNAKRTFPNPLRRLLKLWFAQDADRVFYASIGNDPAMRDMLRMIHPKPATEAHNALFGYLLGKDHVAEDLPPLVKAFEAFKKDPAKTEVPKVPFQMITGMTNLPESVWVGIARNAKWMMTRMNLNTFQRHKVFDVEGMTDLIVKRLADAEQIRKARQFPYQMLSAYMHCSSDVPHAVRDALHDALEVSLENTPKLEGRVVLCPDVSGSMGSPITGRSGKPSKITCVDVAGLFASALLRTNKTAAVLPYDYDVRECRLEPRDTVMTNTQKLARLRGGATNCAAPMAFLNKRRDKVDAVIYISDYESWVDSYRWSRGHSSTWGASHRTAGTSMQHEWQELKRRNPNAKLICIDLTPNTTAQVVPDPSILQVGGFSDNVFKVVGDFLKVGGEKDAWVKAIEATELEVSATRHAV